jgi:Flp pilus assembly pilin Flp
LRRGAIRAFLADEDGASMVEYALMVSLLSMAVITTGTLIARTFNAPLGQVDRGLTPGEMSESEEAARKSRRWGF